MPSESYETDNWLDERRAFTVANGLRICPDLSQSRTYWPEWVRTEVTWRQKTYWVWLDDEYRDLKSGSTALSLEVLLRSLEDYAAYNTAIGWADGMGLAVSVAAAQPAWREGDALGRLVLPAAVSIRQQISDLDWQLNSGRAAVLRGHSG